MSQARNWCFTYHINDSESTAHDSFVSEHKKLRYYIYQLERATTTGQLHYQGYIEYSSPMRFNAVKSHLGEQCHIEQRRGSKSEAVAYCRKSDTRVEGPWEFGHFDGEHGKRKDLDEVSDLIQSGASLREVVECYPVQYIRYRRGIEALHSRFAQDTASKWRVVTVSVYYGDSGAGKTRKAIEETEGDFYILDQGERVWFDGYEDQKTLIIDDFYGWIKYGMLLRILDGHPYRCEIKGGFKWALWERVTITSNKHPEEWYDKGMTPALKRRISNICHFDIRFNE